jgi:hypothetical protein
MSRPVLRYFLVGLRKTTKRVIVAGSRTKNQSRSANRSTVMSGGIHSPVDTEKHYAKPQLG